METALDSPADRPKIGRTKDPQRSAITNGKLLPGIDEDSPPFSATSLLKAPDRDLKASPSVRRGSSSGSVITSVRWAGSRPRPPAGRILCGRDEVPLRPWGPAGGRCCPSGIRLAT